MRRKLFIVLLFVVSCAPPPNDGPALSQTERGALRLGERFPESVETSAVGAARDRIGRNTPRFSELVECTDERVVFKDEERTGADRRMTRRLRSRLLRLAKLVPATWPDVQLRVTEAWDEQLEHGPSSLHYEGRAADLTTSDVDPKKLGRLARLAIDAGFDWVYYEDETHVHVSVK